jgi:hypothetical protein
MEEKHRKDQEIYLPKNIPLLQVVATLDLLLSLSKASSMSISSSSNGNISYVIYVQVRCLFEYRAPLQVWRITSRAAAFQNIP